MADLAAIPVGGAFVTVRRSGKLRSCCGAFGESMPLGQALDRAAVSTAASDPRFPPISPAEMPHLEATVTLLSNSEAVTAHGQDRRKAIVIGTHGVRIVRGGRHGLLLPSVAVEHGFNAEELLDQVCYKAGLPAKAWQADDATLLTFRGHTIKGDLQAVLGLEPIREPTVEAASRRFLGSSKMPLPRANSTAMTRPDNDIRPPAVAGMFYPGDPREVERTLDEWFADKPAAEPWAGALVPHAGWAYSGRLAADVFSRIQFPEQVIILAPGHRGVGAAWAVAPHRVWQLPGGAVASDRELAEQLAASIPGLKLDAAAHAQEHAIEVQLPLVARLAPATRVVGITIHSGGLDDLQRFGRQLAAALASQSKRPLLVISSDMNHFAGENETHRLDRLALDALKTLDPAALYTTVMSNRISMCGVCPAVVALTALRTLGALNRCCEVGYTTSAAAMHDPQRCVGYAGLLFA